MDSAPLEGLVVPVRCTREQTCSIYVSLGPAGRCFAQGFRNLSQSRDSPGHVFPDQGRWGCHSDHLGGPKSIEISSGRLQLTSQERTARHSGHRGVPQCAPSAARAHENMQLPHGTRSLFPVIPSLAEL